MNFDPQKFFIGLMDFFSILLPGALLTYLLMGEMGPAVLGDRYARLAGAEAWDVFLFASYLLGHLVFLLGAWLDEIYDRCRSLTLNKQIRLMACKGELLPWRTRAVIWLVFKAESDRAVERAGRIKRVALGALQATDAVNTFQWCKALLNIESQESLAVVQRFEADSKFFRCFAVVLVLLLLLMLGPLRQTWPNVAIPIVLLLILLALWRYMEQRYKATNQAYWSVITLTAAKGKIAFEKTERIPGDPKYAGGVVYKNDAGVPVFLLVETSDDPSQFELPYGEIRVDPEAGRRETALREAAVRGVHEMAGLWARIEGDPSLLSYSWNGTVTSLRVYPMACAGKAWMKTPSRRHVWCSIDKTKAMSIDSEIRELLERTAADLRRKAGARNATGH